MLNRVQSTQDEKARLIKGNDLKLAQVGLFSFLFFKESTNTDFSEGSIQSNTVF